MNDPPEEELGYIDEVGDRFEDALRSDIATRVEDYLVGTGDLRRRVLEHLLRIDREIRVETGEAVSLADYERRFPDERDIVAKCFAIGHSNTVPPTSGVEINSANPHRPSVSDLPGYEIQNLIGRGGMGIVYLARQVSLDRSVAIKVLSRPPRPDQAASEARLIARVKSPHVVTVFDCPTLGNGRQAIIMEYVEGGSLDRVIAGQAAGITEDEGRRWMAQVCEGMLAAATEGLVHLDLKPGNILIDHRGNAKITDFGLARIPNITGGQTPDAVLAGTPLYMSPEQAGDPRSIDTRSDIYSFGATFYHALTGVPPFVGISMIELRSLHKHAPLTPPNAVNQSLSTWTSEIIERCLAKDPSDRFGSFAELRRALQAKEGSDSPWEMGDDSCPIELWETYRRRRPDYLLRRIQLGGDMYPLREGRRHLVIKCGNLAFEEADAIVNSTHDRLDCDDGLSQALADAAGGEARREWRRYRSVCLRPGRAIVTTAGDLRARFVIHGVTLGFGKSSVIVPSRDLIIEILRSCFYHADSLNLHSITFPLLGTGAGGFSEAVCLDTTFRFLVRALSRPTTNVKCATIVLYNSSLESVP